MTITLPDLAAGAALTWRRLEQAFRECAQAVETFRQAMERFQVAETVWAREELTASVCRQYPVSYRSYPKPGEWP